MLDRPEWLDDRLADIRRRGEEIMAQKKPLFQKIDALYSAIAAAQHEIKVQCGDQEYSSLGPEQQVAHNLLNDKIKSTEEQILKLHTEIGQIDKRGRVVLQIHARARDFLGALPENTAITRLSRKRLEELQPDDDPDVILGLEIPDHVRERFNQWPMAQLFKKRVSPVC